jgi:hypothetical protein
MDLILLTRHTTTNLTNNALTRWARGNLRSSPLLLLIDLVYMFERGLCDIVNIGMHCIDQLVAMGPSWALTYGKVLRISPMIK